MRTFLKNIFLSYKQHIINNVNIYIYIIINMFCNI